MMRLMTSRLINVGIVIGLFGVTLLQLGVTWDISLPVSGSTRTQWAAVPGGGMADVQGSATFNFGTEDSGTWTIENGTSVQSSGMPGTCSWGGTIPNPTLGWTVGNEHYAWIEWINGTEVKRDWTDNHIVN